MNAAQPQGIATSRQFYIQQYFRFALTKSIRDDCVLCSDLSYIRVSKRLYCRYKRLFPASLYYSVNNIIQQISLHRTKICFHSVKIRIGWCIHGCPRFFLSKSRYAHMKLIISDFCGSISFLLVNALITNLLRPYFGTI